jgi:hypothetical protein
MGIARTMPINNNSYAPNNWPWNKSVVSNNKPAEHKCKPNANNKNKKDWLKSNKEESLSKTGKYKTKEEDNNKNRKENNKNKPGGTRSK